MATEQGAVAAEHSLQPSQHAHAAPTSQDPNPDVPDSPSRSNPLKRGREDSPGSPSPVEEEPSHKTTRLAPRTTSPIQLTAAVAALEAERRRREELGQDLSAVHDSSGASVLESLIRSNAAMSQPPDAHTTTAPTATMDVAERPESSSLSIPMSSAQIPPAEPTVLGANGDSNHVGDPGMQGPTVTESPTPMDIDPHLEQADAAQQAEKTASASLSYPGPLHNSSSMATPPNRTMTFPLAASSGQASPPSTGRDQKKHECHVCKTVFTRQHNLKSHMLTHENSKPFQCDKCDMRFRRLHDLKRHSKLHTGEKPHVCPKCDRKFARGDALARHSKGAGGCAGRRSSLGTFIEDEGNTTLTDADDSRVHDPRMQSSYDNVRDSLQGSLYAKYTADAAIAEEERVRQGLSGMKAPQGAGSPANVEGVPQGQAYSRGAAGSGLYAPGADRNSYARRDSDHRTPPSMSLPAGAGGTPKHLANTGPSDGRYAGLGHNGPTTPQSASRGGSGTHAIDNSNNMFAGDISGLWAYTHALEERIAQMEKADREKQAVITALVTNLEALQKQVGRSNEEAHEVVHEGTHEETHGAPHEGVYEEVHQGEPVEQQ